MFSFDRRTLLKVFGLGAAVAPVLHGDTERMEFVEDLQPAPDVASRRLAPYEYLDVVHNHLYSALDIGKQRVSSSLIVGPSGEPIEVRVPNAQSSYLLFSYGVGESPGELGHRTATYSDTNLHQRMRLDAPESYAVSRVGVLFSPATSPRVRESFAERYVFTLWIGKKQYFRAPVASMFAVGEIEATESPAAGFISLEVPIIIANQFSFYVELQGEPNEADELKLWAVLGNLHARGVS